jgi:hypothetical protein
MDAAGAPYAEPSVGQVRVALAIVIAIAVGLAFWLNRGGDDSAPIGSAATPRIVSLPELRSIAAAGPNPIYWVGPRSGAELELTREPGGNAFVRYLSVGTEAGDPRGFLTVGTYFVAHAEASVRRLVRGRRSNLYTARGGLVVAIDPRRPSSVYLADPGANVEVEVFDPSPRRALKVALSGSVGPVH